MKCPRCNYEWKLPGPQAGGRAKVKKGFADPRVQAKAQATRKRKARNGQNDQGQAPGGLPAPSGSMADLDTGK